MNQIEKLRLKKGGWKTHMVAPKAYPLDMDKTLCGKFPAIRDGLKPMHITKTWDEVTCMGCVKNYLKHHV